MRCVVCDVVCGVVCVCVRAVLCSVVWCDVVYCATRLSLMISLKLCALPGSERCYRIFECITIILHVNLGMLKATLIKD